METLHDDEESRTITAPDLGTLTFGYDGSLPLSTTWAGTVAGSVSQIFNNNFQVTSQSVNGANTIAYTYDLDSLLKSAGTQTLNYDPSNGLLTGTVLGNITDSYGYSSFGEMSSYAASDSTQTVFSQSYVRDKLGRITHKTGISNEVFLTQLHRNYTTGFFSNKKGLWDSSLTL